MFAFWPRKDVTINTIPIKALTIDDIKTRIMIIRISKSEPLNEINLEELGFESLDNTSSVIKIVLMTKNVKAE